MMEQIVNKGLVKDDLVRYKCIYRLICRDETPVLKDREGAILRRLSLFRERDRSVQGGQGTPRQKMRSQADG